MIDHNERAAEARALRQAAADVRSMHDPVASDCEEWAAWLDARAARIDQAVSSGGTPPDSPEANARAQAEGQTIALASVQPPTRKQVADVLDSLARTVAFSSRDWGKNPRDAWLWGVLLGWDADEEGDESAMDEMARSHGWSEASVTRLRRLHDVVLTFTRQAIADGRAGMPLGIAAWELTLERIIKEQP